MCLVKERLNPGPGQRQPSAKRLPSADHTEVRSGPNKPGPCRTERYAFYPSVWLARAVLPPPLLCPLFDQSDSTTMSWRFIGTQRLQWHPLLDGVDCASRFLPFIKSSSASSLLSWLCLCPSMSNSEFPMFFVFLFWSITYSDYWEEKIITGNTLVRLISL